MPNSWPKGTGPISKASKYATCWQFSKNLIQIDGCAAIAANNCKLKSIRICSIFDKDDPVAVLTLVAANWPHSLRVSGSFSSHMLKKVK